MVSQIRVMRCFRFFLLTGILAVLSSCGSEAKKPSKAKTQKAEPKAGGTLIYGKSGLPLTLDPAEVIESESSIILTNVFDPLVMQTAGKVDLEPALAKSWDISADGLTYTFHLRQNVFFHDGTRFNADAVVFSIQRQSDPRHAFYDKSKFQNWINFNLDKIFSGVNALDDSTVQMKLKQPNAPFLNLISMDLMGIVSPAAVKKFGRDFDKNPVGCGPFVFSRWKTDGEIVLTANRNYWNGVPFLDSLVFRPIPNARERWRLLASGKIDLMDSPDNEDLEQVRKFEDIKMVSQSGVNICYIALNTMKTPFNDVRVRRAINMAINKNYLVSAVYGASGRAAKNPIPPVLPGYNNKIRPLLFSQDSAISLLAAAGFPDGFSCKLWALPISRQYMPDGQKAATIIQQNLLAVGIKAEIVTYPWREYLDRTYRGEHDMAMLGWVGDIPDPDNFFGPLLSKEAAEKVPSTNRAFYKSDEMQALITAGQRTHDPVKRREIYQKACEVFNKDFPWVSIAHSEVNVPLRKNVMGFQLFASSRRRFEKVWKD